MMSKWTAKFTDSILTVTVCRDKNVDPKSQPEVKAEEREIRKPATRAAKQRKKHINKSALREIKYEPRQLPVLGKKETFSKKKGGISLEEMHEQYNWLYNAKQVNKVSTAEPKPRVKVLTIDHTSLVTPDTRNQDCPLSSKLAKSYGPPRREEKCAENLTFLLQFKRRFIGYV